MSPEQCATPVTFSEIIDYFQGELTIADEERVEAHFFECASCYKRFETISNLGYSIKHLAARGQIGGVINSEFVQRAKKTGVTIREYKISPGMTVSCKAGPEDLVLVRLKGKFSSAKELALEIDFRNLEEDQSTPTVSRIVEVDREGDEIMVVFPGDEVRSYPRSIWKLRAYSATEGPDRELGAYCLDHTP